MGARGKERAQKDKALPAEGLAGSARDEAQGKALASGDKSKQTSGIENISIEALKESASDRLDDRLHLLEEEFHRPRQIWSWKNLVEKAEQRYAFDCFVSCFAWRQARQVFTPYELAVIYVLMKRDHNKIDYPNAYLKALMKRKASGQLHLDFAVFAARERLARRKGTFDCAAT